MNQKLFRDKIKKGVSLVDFCASGSEPCIVQKAVIDQLSGKHKGKASIMIIDVDDHRDLAMSFGITSIPTLIIYKNGDEIKRLIGLQNMEILSEILMEASGQKNDQ